MTTAGPHPIWPFFDLEVRTPLLTLRYVDDAASCALAELAAKGIHGPDMMPFNIPWSEEPSPELERNVMQYHWKLRAEMSPTKWSVELAVHVEGEIVGVTGLMATDFGVVREFETGSWLGRAHQGKGIGKEMRTAALQLGFAGFGAGWAVTSAWEDNGPSRGVTRHLGYTEQGRKRRSSKDTTRTLVGYEMSREFWDGNVRRDDIELLGVEPCLGLLGAAPVRA